MPETRSLRAIALEILKDWKNIRFCAKPHAEAMLELNSIDDPYYEDTARYVVLRFLANAGTWRGETARRIKAELKSMLGKY